MEAGTEPPAGGAAAPPPGFGSVPPAGGTPGAFPGGVQAPAAELKSKLVAALLGIFVGFVGVHRFYLGYNTIGIIQLLVSLVLAIPTCGISCVGVGIWGLVEGIMILTGNINKDALGRPLRE